MRNRLVQKADGSYCMVQDTEEITVQVMGAVSVEEVKSDTEWKAIAKVLGDRDKVKAILKKRTK